MKKLLVLIPLLICGCRTVPIKGNETTKLQGAITQAKESNRATGKSLLGIKRSSDSIDSSALRARRALDTADHKGMILRDYFRWLNSKK